MASATSAVEPAWLAYATRILSFIETLFNRGINRVYNGLVIACQCRPAAGLRSSLERPTGFLLLKLDALQEEVVELPVFLISSMAYHNHVHLARPGKVIAIKGKRLRAALMPEVDGGGSGDL